jgi:hypothetical protein
MQTQQEITESMKKVSDEVDLQSLYSDVSFAIDKAIESNKDKEKLLTSFENDMQDIIYALHEQPRAIPSAKLPRTLIPLIKILLTAENADHFDKINLRELFADPEVELNKIKKIYQLCKNEPFKSIIIGLHRRFKHEYFSRFDVEAMRINKEERAICYAIDSPISPPEHIEKMKKELIALAKYAIKIRDTFFAEQKYFEQYKLDPRDVVYVTTISFTFDSLIGSAKKLLATTPPQGEQQQGSASLAKKFKPKQ